MGTSPVSVKNEPLILQVCSASFPDSPEFVMYLVDRLVSLDGSYELARILCLTLYTQQFPHRSRVSAECVRRLSVDMIPGAVGKINSSHPNPFKITSNVLVFLMQVSGIIEDLDTDTPIDELPVTPRTSIWQHKKDAYVKLFCCAQAMLAGLKVNPRDISA